MASYIHAGLRRHYDVVKYLIDCGADLAAHDGYAIHYAGEYQTIRKSYHYSLRTGAWMRMPNHRAKPRASLYTPFS